MCIFNLSVSNVLPVTSDPVLWVIFTSLCSLFHNYTYFVVVLILIYLLPIIFCVVYLFYDKRPFALECELIFRDSVLKDLIKIKTWQMTEIDEIKIRSGRRLLFFHVTLLSGHWGALMSKY